MGPWLVVDYKLMLKAEVPLKERLKEYNSEKRNPKAERLL